jgi:hypothetical protein
MPTLASVRGEIREADKSLQVFILEGICLFHVYLDS